MKVVVAGSRDITDYNVVRKAIEESGYNITTLISGTARGVDQLGERYAELNGIEVKLMPANWNLHGKKAGPLRNKAMAEYSDSAIIIWDGKSKGTSNMIKNLIKLKKPYRLILTEDFVEEGLDKFF